VDSRSDSYECGTRTCYRTLYDIECRDCYDWEGTRNSADGKYDFPTPVPFLRQCKTRAKATDIECGGPFENSLCDARYSDDGCPGGSRWPGSLAVNTTVQCWAAVDPPPPSEYDCENDRCAYLFFFFLSFFGLGCGEHGSSGNLLGGGGEMGGVFFSVSAHHF
jgi:hypothetical protein